jgi:hypothetical protein
MSWFCGPVRPAKAGMFSGRQSHRGKSKSPVAWVASAEETKRMKPTDKAILGMVSESSGRKESEPRSGLVKICFRKSRSLVRNEDCMAAGRLADAACHFGGVVGTARWQGRAEQLVKPSSSHREIGGALERAKEVTRYERWTAVEYARFADDLVILVDSHPRRRWLRQAVESDYGRSWPNCRCG